MQTLKVSLIHLRIRNKLQDNLQAAGEGIRKAAQEKPAFIALPEYFSVPNSMEDFTGAERISRETYQASFRFLSEISKEFPDIYIMGGTVLEEDNKVFYNTSTLWRKGALVGKYRKRNPIPVLKMMALMVQKHFRLLQPQAEQVLRTLGNWIEVFRRRPSI